MRRSVLFLAVLVLGAGIARGQPGAPAEASGAAEATPAAPAPSTGTVTPEAVEAKREAVESAEDIDAAVKQSAVSLYQEAAGHLEQMSAFQAEAASAAEDIRTAPQRIEELRRQLSQPLPEADAVAAEAASVPTDQLEQRLRQGEVDLSAARARLAEKEAALEGLAEPDALRQQVAQARQVLDEIAAELRAQPPADQPPAVAEARRTLLLARQRKRQAEVQALEQKLLAHDVRRQLLSAERDLAAREISRLETRVRAMRDALLRQNQRAAQQARQEAEAAQREAAQLPPAIRELADTNLELSRQLEQLTANQSRVARGLQEVRSRLEEVQQQFASAQERVEKAGLTETIGLLLHKQREELPSPRRYRQQAAERQAALREAAAAEIVVEERLRSLGDDQVEQRVDQVVQRLSASVSESRREELRAEARKLLADRRELAQKLLIGYRAYLNDLGELDYQQRQLVEAASAFRSFINEHLLWTRSAPRLSGADFGRTAEAVRWLGDVSRWRRTAGDAWSSIRSSPVLWFGALAAALGLIAARRWARRDLMRIAERTQSFRTDTLRLTARAAAVTLVLAVGRAALPAAVGGCLLAYAGASDFSQAAGRGLLVAAVLLGTIDLLMAICRPAGLAEAHFRWPEGARRSLRAHLRWLAPTLAPLGFAIGALYGVEEQAVQQSLGRLAFMAAMVSVAVFLGLALRAGGGLMSMVVRRSGNGWLARLRYVWAPLAASAPLVLGALAAMGYFYTSLQLAWRVQGTIWLVIGAAATYELCLRWLRLAKRRMRIDEARRRRETAMKQREGQEGAAPGGGGGEGEAVAVEEPEMDAAEMDEQAQSLVRTVLGFTLLVGLWAVWAQVLPALGVLNEVELWTYSATVDGEAVRVPITLASVALAILVLTLSVIAARNLPGVLEMTLLSRLPLDAGARYATVTVCRYVITIVGFVAAFNAIGIGWSQVQWLVAALSVGLGFGLQEIVANFVCGLILLFERPIRVGDVVTVGDATGTVSRIRIRATTLTDWDRKELVVPNKEFVTGRLLNWTLSNEVNRVVVTVGVAYGSDTKLAQRLIREAAESHPNVLKDPAPSVWFEGFGDNALNFVLRAYLPDLSNRLQTVSELHMEIDRRFRDAGISIAFPQRDVHLDASGPVEIQVTRQARRGGTTEPQPQASAAGDGGRGANGR